MSEVEVEMDVRIRLRKIGEGYVTLEVGMTEVEIVIGKDAVISVEGVGKSGCGEGV